MNTKLISIAMATYNGEKYLREQLDSIYNQTYKNIEVIVCDDCSTDGTVQILEEYKQKYGLKYFINEKNLGYIKNFEKSIKLCSGDYIALSDQDDIWLLEKLETLVNEIGENILIYCDAIDVDINNNILHDSRVNYFYKEIYFKVVNIEKIAEDTLIGCVCLFKKELLNIAHPFPKETGHDNWLMMISKELNSIKFLNNQLIKRRIHENNTGKVNINNNLSLSYKIKMSAKFIFGKLFFIIRDFYYFFKVIKFKKIIKKRIYINERK